MKIGYWILAELRPIRNLLPGVLHHHERVDGTGYPAGLAHDQIPLLARILAVADAYDAMSHQRPYRESLPYHRVEETLVAGAGTQWDKAIVDAFLRSRQRIEAVSQRPIKSAVRKAVESSLTDSKNSPFTGPHRRKRLLDPVARAFNSFSEMHFRRRGQRREYGQRGSERRVGVAWRSGSGGEAKSRRSSKVGKLTRCGLHVGLTPRRSAFEQTAWNSLVQFLVSTIYW